MSEAIHSSATKAPCPVLSTLFVEWAGSHKPTGIFGPLLGFPSIRVFCEWVGNHRTHTGIFDLPPISQKA